MGTENLKAKRAGAAAAATKPSVARAEIVDKNTRARFEAELEAALKRKPASEVKLAGALRAVAALSPALRGSLVEATQLMVKRGSYTRDIYGACLRTLAESDDRNVPAILRTALAAEDAGGNATLSAASFCKDPSLAPTLAKLAASRQSHLAFGAETARVCRRESNGAHLTAIAPMIKESHRIALCVELFVPLARGGPVPVVVGPALGVLRGAERHLGRWLVLADVATKAGDLGPLQEATAKAQVGPSSARAAWSLVAWALAQTRANALEAAGSHLAAPSSAPLAAPITRPTVELVARLSDRPSADRDTTFLFRMARARAATCRPMLEGLAKSAVATNGSSLPAAPASGPSVLTNSALTISALTNGANGEVRVTDAPQPLLAAVPPSTPTLTASRDDAGPHALHDEIAVRAASYLVRDHGRADMKEALLECAQNARRDELRGFAVAALWDTGDADAREKARDLADELVSSRSRCISSVAWGVLVRAAHAGALGKGEANFVVASETPFRWIQWGWLE